MCHGMAALWARTERGSSPLVHLQSHALASAEALPCKAGGRPFTSMALPSIPFLTPLLSWFYSIFFQKHLEICVLGLQSAGKTSLVNLLAIGQFSDEMVPTVGFNMRKVKSGNVAIKVWDIG